METELDRSDDLICPNSNCEYDHHSKGANFCILCGTLLYQRCEDCLSANPQYAKFCYYCGTSLLELRSSEGQYEGSEEI
ncbi:MAG: zinc ribbon domain-containing protein [Candidatus Scalinduaceae bacterium]